RSSDLHYLQQPNGRLFQFTCDADLGDHRCKVDIGSSIYRGTGTIAAVLTARTFEVTGLESYADGWFSRGLLTFVSGANAEHSMEIRSHRQRDGAARIELWQEPSQPAQSGDGIEIKAGCDKQLATCRDKLDRKSTR